MAAEALYNLTAHDEGQRQVAGLGYTRDQLIALYNWFYVRSQY
jgi:hypothetical protein